MTKEVVQLSWRKSQRSAAFTDCVEVAEGPTGDVFVRDSKDPDGPTLRFDRATWRLFLAEVKRGRFDVAREDDR